MLPSLSARSSALVALLHEEFPNYHPLISIVRLAHNPNADLRLQFDCHKVIAKYVEPELKSVEVKQETKAEKLVKVSLFNEEDVQDAVFSETE